MIGIISAMPIEIEKLKSQMTNITSEIISKVTYFKGQLNGVECVIAVGGVGKVNSAVCAQTMVLQYSPKLIINVGVAGGLLPNMNIGDIVVADNAVQHDVDTSAVGDPVGMISTINIINIPCDKELAKKITHYYKEPEIFVGTIACGDQFIIDKMQLLKINNHFNAIACDMETASIAHVCYLNNIKFSSIRVISDNVHNDKSNINYDEFKVMAANKACKILFNIIVNA